MAIGFGACVFVPLVAAGLVMARLSAVARTRMLNSTMIMFDGRWFPQERRLDLLCSHIRYDQDLQMKPLVCSFERLEV